MAETDKNMTLTTVVFGDEVYNLAYIPSKDSLIVETKARYIEKLLMLKQFGNEDIVILGKLVQLAYFGVIRYKDLQIEVRPALNTVSDLCDDIIHTLNKVKRSLHGALIRIQTVYEYIENSYERNAMQALQELQTLSQNLLKRLQKDSNLLSQNSRQKKELFLKVRHIAEKEKQVVVDEGQKKMEQLSASKIEKCMCEFLIKKSNKTIAKQKSQIVDFKNKIDTIIKGKASIETEFKNELEKANKKHEEKMNKLKAKYDSNSEKLIKDFKKKPKKSNSTGTKTSVPHEKFAAEVHCNKSDEKLRQENKQSQLPVDEDKSALQINHPVQSIHHKDINSTDHNTQCTIAEGYTQTEAIQTPAKTENTENFQQSTLNSIKTKDDKLETKECAPMDTAVSQVEKSDSVEVVSTKEGQLNEKQIMAHDGSTPSNDKDSADTNVVKRKEKTLEQQQEALLQEHLNNMKQLELEAQKSKENMQKKYQNKLKGLDVKLEKLNQQLTTSENLIKENEQKLIENQQKQLELVKIISEKTKLQGLNNESKKHISNVIAALYTIGSIMKKFENFFRDLTALCHKLFNNQTISTQIKYLQGEVWKSNAFKVDMLFYSGNCVAFTSVCTTTVEFIIKAQEEIYQNVCKDLTEEETIRLVQELAPIVLPQIELD